ncbi:DUF885 family protein [Sphingomonas sp.]|jgi:uncharacterized protein (DUF885 family)|uniref:DUF885 family protein n=1 Tax=Sphingomonas sp. TaxID=28214 RepID=UPI003566849E
MTTRRALLAGGAALALAGRVRAARPISLRAALDAAAALPHDPGAALALLAGYDLNSLGTSAQLDLDTARAGLAIDRDIVQRFAVDPRAKGPPRNPAHAALLLRRKLGNDVDPRAAATRLEAERRRCAARADALFARLGVAGANTGARFSALWYGPRYAYPNPDAALADMNRWLAVMRPHVPALVGMVPPWCLNVAANPPTTADIAQAHFGYRTLPTPTQPGGYVPDLQRLADRPAFTLPSVVAHELLPGHMVQLPLEAAADPHPLRLDYAPGFAEGWGIYAERRVADAGLYAADPLAELGYLHWRLFRIGRALADLALHLHGLSLAEARARLVTWQGEPAYFAPFDADLARIVQEPMTRAGEMLFALAIEDGARRRTGPALARYHQVLLRDGRMRSDELARRARRV